MVAMNDTERQPTFCSPDQRYVGILRRHVPDLTPREAVVLVDRFIHRTTLAWTGERLGINRERVRQIEAKALCKIRRKCNGRHRCVYRLLLTGT